ncbi:diiron oxygenase [Nocardioides panacisoli]|uniref:Diiron oxygenase n=1 Tax=Nocardioides panacisoli TaxID=627624 RepID=A0ABP7J086_9ACTN
MTAVQTYDEKLQTLSEGSVRLSFNAFKDIPWDDPAYAIVPNDRRWILPTVDPLGSHAWYQGLPEERQIEIGMARMANIAKVGWQFENVLIKGVLEYLMDVPNGTPEFRYLMHEVTEETHHIQMFQEFVNRTGSDIPGGARWFRVVQSVLPVFGRLLPEIFFTGVLAGEEPIDHLQKSILRSGDDLHPLIVRIMQIHVAEEARHISFAHEFIARKAPTLGRARKALLSVAYPVVMRLLCDVIATPSREFIKRYDIPKQVIDDLYWDAPESQKLLRDLFADVRVLAGEAGLMNPVSRVLWKRLHIDGRPARFRSEPAPKAA